MVDNLRNRSLSSKFYVSASSHASTPLNQWDTDSDDKLIKKLENINGDAQGKFKY